MTRHTPAFAIRLAATAAEIEAAQALRHDVFVQELGATVPVRCAHAGREWDAFDEACEHLILIDSLRGSVVGAARLLDEAGAARVGGFASEEEFDLAALRRSGRRLLEVGRVCVHPAYRAGLGTHRMWLALAGIVEAQGVGLLFGLASLPGTDPRDLAAPLSLLARDHIAPAAIRPASRHPATPGVPTLDRRAATLALPPLVKTYLRLGGKVGEGSFVDRRFGCTDVCMVVDAAALGGRARALLQSPPT